MAAKREDVLIPPLLWLSLAYAPAIPSGRAGHGRQARDRTSRPCERISAKPSGAWPRSRTTTRTWTGAHNRVSCASRSLDVGTEVTSAGRPGRGGDQRRRRGLLRQQQPGCTGRSMLPSIADPAAISEAWRLPLTLPKIAVSNPHGPSPVEGPQLLFHEQPTPHASRIRLARSGARPIRPLHCTTPGPPRLNQP